MVDQIEIIQAAALDGVPHGFFGRRGGVSTGMVAGLNAGFGALDEDAAVAENRQRAADAVLPGAQLATLCQVHSPDAVIVRQGWAEVDRPRADALATGRPGVMLGIVTADCAPVLLADKHAGVVGAAHAGWRGAHDGVIASTVAAMEQLGAVAARIIAVIGPCIAQASYEVDQSFRDRFAAQADLFFAAGKAGHFQFDLAAYVASRVIECGVGSIETLGLDTYTDDTRFFSYRRAVHRGEGTYGRQISLIAAAGP